MSRSVPPGEAVKANLQQVQGFLDRLSIPAAAGEQQTKVAVAQVYATAALVHAVRDLTDVIRTTLERGE